MCGVVGFWGDWPENLLLSMIEGIKHRGPDGRGHFYDPEEKVGLGHVRLSIIDLTERAGQPLWSSDKRYVISFNGEIYNYVKLRQELSDQYNIDFQTQGDTEVLLYGYIHEGVNILQKLQGIFAFAIWDSQDRTMFIARDHLGVKPIYYSLLPDGLIFASELKVLTFCPDLPRDLCSSALASHIANIWASGDETILKHVKKLRPGHYIIADCEKINIERYYQSFLPDPARNLPSISPAQLRDKIDEVVQEQMIADVPVGALLSGGLDSSAIVASMCKFRDPEQIVAFCARVSKDNSRADNFGDDDGYARLVASKLGVRLISVDTDIDLAKELPAMVWGLDEPTPDFSALQVQKLAQRSREEGIKVLLSGVGGDDLFSGYGRHWAAYAYEKLGKIPIFREMVGGLLACFRPNSLHKRRLRRIGLLLGQDEERMLVEAMSYSEVDAERQRELFTSSYSQEMDESKIHSYLVGLLKESSHQDLVTRLLHFELNTFLPDHNLNYTDKMAMRAGVEVRVPLIDPKLVEFGMKIPIHQKMNYRWTKKIFRDSQVGRLPKEVLFRPKQGFGVPLRAWLAGPAQSLLNEATSKKTLTERGIFDHRAVSQLRQDFLGNRVDAAFTLFSVLCIELWCQALDAIPRVGR
jgi:asparagine synthase (glutamine-hydrolysing)